MAKKAQNSPKKPEKRSVAARVKKATASAASVPVTPKAKKPATKKAAAESRLPHATRPTKAEELVILERQNLVIDLKTNGVSFRRIQKRLEELGHDVSLGTVHADYVASLERLQESNVIATELLVAQELAKLEDWEFDLNALKSRRNLSVYEVTALKTTLIQIQNQKDKFLGLSKPKVVRFETDEDFARALGITKEQLPKDGDESED